MIYEYSPANRHRRDHHHQKITNSCDQSPPQTSRPDAAFTLRRSGIPAGALRQTGNSIAPAVSSRSTFEGSVRQSGNRVRVNAQLIDAETNAHPWAGRFDGNTLD